MKKKKINVAINGIRIVVISTKCKTDNTIMYNISVNENSLVRSTQDFCIILLPFQLKRKTAKSALLRKLVRNKKKRLKTTPEVQGSTVKQCLDVPLKSGIHQYFNQLFLRSVTRMHYNFKYSL